MSSFFFFNDTATTEIYTLSLHDALPISDARRAQALAAGARVHLRARDPFAGRSDGAGRPGGGDEPRPHRTDRHAARSEEHTSELQSRLHLVCRLLLEKKKKRQLEGPDAD